MFPTGLTSLGSGRRRLPLLDGSPPQATVLGSWVGHFPQLYSCLHYGQCHWTTLSHPTPEFPKPSHPVISVLLLQPSYPRADVLKP